MASGTGRSESTPTPALTQGFLPFCYENGTAPTECRVPFVFCGLSARAKRGFCSSLAPQLHSSFPANLRARLYRFPFTDYRLPVDIAALLHPYRTGLSATQLAQVSDYLDLLLRWNARMNLTAIRDPEQIVSRHFGESFFLASKLFGAGASQLPDYEITELSILDVGSGAGFPGIPLKIACPGLTITLVEANQRKAVFLREVIRALHLDVEVKNVRAENLPPASAGLVTLRAVEKFDSILPVAARLVRTDEITSERTPPPVHAMRSNAEPEADPTQEGKPIPRPRGLALLISSAQISRVQELLPKWRFYPEIPIPNSQNRVIQLVEPN